MNTKPRGYWNEKRVRAIAKIYETRNEFKRGKHGSAYTSARKLGILNDVCSHMTPQKQKWTYEKIHKVALKYKTRIEFSKSCRSGYDSALGRGIMDEVCSHMTSKIRSLSNTDIKKIALTYTKRHHFKMGDEGAYKTALDRGVIDKVCSHMKEVTKYSKESLKEIALQYETKSEFVYDNESAYQQCRYHNILDEVCSHMVSANVTTDTVYVWTIPNTNIYKIGVSSSKAGDRRIKQVANTMGVDYKIVGMYIVNEPYKVEKELHNTYQILPTTLPKTDGHTEFRILTESDVNEITYYLENIVGKKI